MAQVCTKCSHVNPGDAVYCYFDGALLQGHGVNGSGPMNPGLIPFPSPFVFPTGQQCQNFDQLAMACQQNWKTACDLLRQGFLVGFFGSMGRADLAMAAQEAAQFPDQDRGLDQLLSKLPSQALQNPKLRVEPTDINLGIVPMGTDRTIELHLSNQGMRLLHGSVASDSKWLLLGDAPGQQQKLFQFGDETVIPVHIRGQQLRAGPKPLVGQLFIESNGGQATVKVRLEVPVKPFSEGVLAGATTPRQLAEKAKLNPKEAAVLFENGKVAAWFKQNGWIYPVQGPAGSGLGAVQQFFEALGLAKAPRVMVDKQSIALVGGVGQQLQTTIKVETPEKRPVYAHATADEPWLDVSQREIQAKGRIVLIHVRVSSVPARPGQTLTAKVRVAANGNQRFDIPVALTIQGAPGGAYPQPVYAQPAFASAGPAFALLDEPIPVAAASPPPLRGVVAMPADTGAVVAMPTQPMPAVVAMPAANAGGAVGYQTPSAAVTSDGNAPFGAFALGAAPVGQQPGAPPVPRRSIRKQQLPFVVHLIPAALLAFALLLIVGLDLFAPPARPDDDIAFDYRPRVSIAYNYPMYGKPVDKHLGSNMLWGLRTIPPEGEREFKKLTFDIHGASNSTVLRIDGKPVEFGNGNQGQWTVTPHDVNKYGTSKEAVWRYQFAPIEIAQKVERIPGEPFLAKKGERIYQKDGTMITLREDTYIRALDTCLVRYEIVNRDQQPHKIGLRSVVDTYIGTNDGVPFTVPGVGLVTDKREFPKAAPIPDFLQALEKADLKDPGTVVQINLKLGAGYESPTRVLLTRWPGWKLEGNEKTASRQALNEWDVPLRDFQDDSAVVLYWDEQDLPPAQTRKFGFLYGLGHVTSATGKLGITVGGPRTAGSELTITAYVNDPAIKEVTLNLPAGLTLLGDAQPKQVVPPAPQGVVGQPIPVTWRVRAESPGRHNVSVIANTNESQSTTIDIRSKAGIFGSS